VRFQATIHIDGAVASIRLTGELDAQSASTFQELIADAAQAGVGRLVLLLHDLTYLSSAGLRCLVFAHQKLGPAVDIVLVGARPEVAEVITMTGFDKSVVMYQPVLP